MGTRGSVVGWRTMLQAGRSPVRVPDEVDFFNLPNPSSRTMALESIQPLTEMSTRNLPGGKKRPCMGLTTLPPSVSRMSENVGASTSLSPKGLRGLYTDNFTRRQHESKTNTEGHFAFLRQNMDQLNSAGSGQCPT
jgi:hypothetical protein